MQLTFISAAALLTVSVTACGGAVSTNETVTNPEEPTGAGVGAARPPPTGGISSEATTSCEAPLSVETIADLTGDPNLTTGRIVVDEIWLFVDTSRGTYRARKCGGGPAVRISENAPGQYTASGLVQDRDSLYLAATAPLRGGFVRRIAKDGSRTEELVGTSRDLFGLALVPERGGRLYWVERMGKGDALREMLVTTRDTKSVAELETAYSYGPFCSDASGIGFFALTGSNHGTFYDFTPERGLSPSAVGPAAVEMVTGPEVDGGKAPDRLFSFGHTGSNGVGRVARAGTSIDVVAASRAPYGLAWQSAALYFTDSADGVVRRCTLAPASSTASCDETATLASGEDDPRFITADSSGVYWATRRGLLRRAPL